MDELFKNIPDDQIEMWMNPLTTEDGFLNEACIKELDSALKNIPETHNRLSNDPEWSLSTWTTVGEIIGAFANSAIQISINMKKKSCIPKNVEKLCELLRVSLLRDNRFKNYYNLWMAKLSLCDINKLCWDILGDVSFFTEWNEGEDFIDLSALLHHVCILIRNERRHHRAFDIMFEKKYDYKF